VRFEDFVLQLDATARGDFRARVVKSPFGEGGAGFSLPPLGSLAPDSLDIASRNMSSAAQPAPAVVRPPLEIGAELYRSVFQGAVRSLLDKSRGQLERETDLGLRLKVKIDPSDPDTGILADLPWELLCDETEDCFALSRQTSVVRYLDVPRSSQPIPFTPPLKILAAGASPRDLPALDLDEEIRRLEELNRSGSGVHVRVLPHASAGSIRQALAEDSFNVLHFMGHGTFDPATGDGGLACETADGGLDLVSGRAFATKLRDLRSLGVVVLNACNTARAQNQEGGSPFRGVATALVLGGVPAVVAMQRPISDRAAIGFSTAFYRHLANGDSIDIALTEGRQAIHSARPEAFEWATPVLFLRLPEGNVFVARPASPAAPPLPAATATPAAPEVAPPPPPPQLEPEGPAPRKRGLTLKIASGAGGALLVGTLVYRGMVQPHPSAPAQGTETAQVTQTTEPDPEVKPKTHGATGSGGRTNSGTGKTGAPSSGVKTADNPGAQSPVSTPPLPVGSDSQAPKKPEAAAPSADVSQLSAELTKIARRTDGSDGLQVTVSFHNGSGQPISAPLVASLSNNQGQNCSVLASDLPMVGADENNPSLSLAAGATAPHTFDFQAPKLGSTKFTLALSTVDGHRIRVQGSTVTLEGSP
jgi:CHAT domain